VRRGQRHRGSQHAPAVAIYAQMKLFSVNMHHSCSRLQRAEMSVTRHGLDVREEQFGESASAELRSRGEIGNRHDQMGFALHLSRGNVEHAEKWMVGFRQCKGNRGRGVCQSATDQLANRAPSAALVAIAPIRSACLI